MPAGTPTPMMAGPSTRGPMAEKRVAHRAARRRAPAQGAASGSSCSSSASPVGSAAGGSPRRSSVAGKGAQDAKREGRAGAPFPFFLAVAERMRLGEVVDLEGGEGAQEIGVP